MAALSEEKIPLEWSLASGTWTLDEVGQAFLLKRTSAGHNVAALVPQDVQMTLEAKSSTVGDGALHPPEFEFDVASGKPLISFSKAGTSSLWIPPFGTAPLQKRMRGEVRGLRQVDLPLSIANLGGRAADGTPDVERHLPPAGSYEFFSVPAATRAAALMALEASKGLVYGWLPGAGRWEALEHADGRGLLAETGLKDLCWRCEVTVEGQCSRLFIPTDEGLACLQPDLLALKFEVRYAGDGRAIGAPIQLGERVWAPVRQASGRVIFVGMDFQGEAGGMLDVSAILPADVNPVQMQAPVVCGRLAIWLTELGQLVLRLTGDGLPEVRFQPWPITVQPSLEFGCAHHASDGSLWQLCFDGARGQYVYLKLGITATEMYDALPRQSSGNFNFRFATKYQSPPWQEPEHGDHTDTETVVFPILECTADKSVYGVLLESTQALATLLKSQERLRVVLVVDDMARQTAFHTMSAPEPWRLRLFRHDGCLWAYHPTQLRLNGWKLQP